MEEKNSHAKLYRSDIGYRHCLPWHSVLVQMDFIMRLLFASCPTKSCTRRLPERLLFYARKSPNKGKDRL